MTDQLDEELPDEIEEAPAPAPEPTYTPEEAEEAKTFGWKAPDEWAGEKPPGYIADPKAYLDRLNKMTPFRTIKEQQARERAEFDERIRKIEALSSMQLKAQKEAYDREIAEISKRQRAAVDLADAETYDALEARKKAMQAPVDAPAAPVPQADPYVAEYFERNDWVKNPILRKTGAELIDAAGMATRPVREQIEYAEREMRRMYPAYFPANETTATPQRPVPQRVDGGGLGAGASTAGGFAKLPSEAKAQFAREVENGIFANNDEGRKKYADLYNSL